MAARFGNINLRKLADKSEGSREQMVVVPAGSFELQDDGSVVITNVLAGEPRLVNPDTPGYDHEAWPLAGVRIMGKPPSRAKLPHSWVQRGVGEGWLDLEGQSVVHRPGGPASDPWRVTHTFIHAEAIVFKTVDGDVRYVVEENPDKYESASSDETGEAGDPNAAIYWSYHVRLES
jgi:hypothetical protein